MTRFAAALAALVLLWAPTAWASPPTEGGMDQPPPANTGYRQAETTPTGPNVPISRPSEAPPPVVAAVPAAPVAAAPAAAPAPPSDNARMDLLSLLFFIIVLLFGIGAAVAFRKHYDSRGRSGGGV